MTRPLFLFVCPGSSSLGELHNAVTAAMSAGPAFEFEFLVTRRFENYVSTLGFKTYVLSEHRAGLSDLTRVVELRKPDHVVIADHHLLALEQTGISIGELDWPGHSVSAFDSLSLGPSQSFLGHALSGLKGSERIARWTGRVEIEPLPPSIALIRPVPVANGPADSSFALYPARPQVRTAATDIRRNLGIPQKARLVVFARSKWARQAYSLLSMLSRNKGTGSSPTDAMALWFHEAFSRLNEPVFVYGLDPGKNHFQDSRVLLRDLPFLGLEDFNDLLAAADLYITDNLVSAAMARAARVGTPCLAMTNISGKISDDIFSQQWHSQMSSATPGYNFPFVVNPFGWVDELAHLLTDNPYLESIPRAEIFDMEDLVQSIYTEMNNLSPAASIALEEDYKDLPNFEEFAENFFAPHTKNGRSC